MTLNRSFNFTVASFLIGFSAFINAAHAQDIGAITSGNWEDNSLWTGSVIPGSSSNVYIGSNTPVGSALDSTVDLTQDESAQNLYLGYGGGNGTLNLAGNTLSISNILNIGNGSSVGTLIEGGGSFTASTLTIDGGNAFTFGTNDQVSNTLNIYNGSTATTTATGNVSGSVNVYSGSTLNLG